jgi:Holliday junction resolvasome RuvABC ATP-dependent DNA helicase subunit
MLTEEQNTKLKAAFRPHSAIEDPDSFFGRKDELARVKAGIFQPGQHVVIYGERGAGKTSLANVATDRIGHIQIFCEEKIDFARLAKHIVQEYQKFDPAKLNYDALRDRVTVDGVVLPLGNLDGNSLRRILPSDIPLCIVLDELDRIKDAAVIADLGEFAKNLSTYQNNLTLIFVGVANDAKSLLKGHASVFRNLKDVPLGRMEIAELKDIIKNGESILKIQFLSEIIEEIIAISDRMPYYLHLLATNAAEACLEAGAKKVDDTHLNLAIQAAAQDADQTLSEAYNLAILSVKGSPIYRYSLWALAERAGVSHKVSEIEKLVNEYAIAEGKDRVSVQAIGQALKALGTENKGSIVTQNGKFFHSLTHPLMKGYIRLIRRK